MVSDLWQERKLTVPVACVYLALQLTKLNHPVIVVQFQGVSMHLGPVRPVDAVVQQVVVCWTLWESNRHAWLDIRMVSGRAL